MNGMVKKIKDIVFHRLSERLKEDSEKMQHLTDNYTKLQCWKCGNYEQNAEQCYHCQHCNIWTLKKIFIPNRRYLQFLNNEQLQKIGIGQ